MADTKPDNPAELQQSEVRFYNDKLVEVYELWAPDQVSAINAAINYDVKQARMDGPLGGQLDRIETEIIQGPQPGQDTSRVLHVPEPYESLQPQPNIEPQAPRTPTPWSERLARAVAIPTDHTELEHKLGKAHEKISSLQEAISEMEVKKEGDLKYRGGLHAKINKLEDMLSSRHQALTELQTLASKAEGLSNTKLNQILAVAGYDPKHTPKIEQEQTRTPQHSRGMAW